MRRSFAVALLPGLLHGLLHGCAGGATTPDAVEEPAGPPVALHRLNRVEYDLTTRDLLGTTSAPSTDFPSDDSSHGFDNISDILSLTPIQLELYRVAARNLVTELIGAPPLATIEPTSLSGPRGAAYHGRGWRLDSGTVSLPYAPPAPGELRVAVFGRALDEGAQLTILVDGRELFRGAPGRVAALTTVTSTRVALAIGAIGSILIEGIRVEGPLDRARPSRLFSACQPEPFDACARTILGPLLRRAFRRPVSATELEGYVDVARVRWDRGERFEESIGLAIEAALVSPKFLFRVEPARELDDHAIASRLSYYLWSSMPDDRLFELADGGQLRDPAVLRQEAARMLADPRSRALIENLAGQWLRVRALGNSAPDKSLFPEFDDDLRARMAEEMTALLADLVGNDRPIEDLLLADPTSLDPRLAQHYGDQLEDRRGVLGKGAFLVSTSRANRTSPVQRGQWVLDALLCSPPPPPPPDVPPLPSTTSTVQGSLRSRLARHVSDPRCAGCHLVMDPIGFGLERFDAIGRSRDVEGGEPVDTSGEIFGRTFSGPRALGEIIAAHPELRRCVARKLFTYAMGRAPVAGDGLDLLAASANGFSSLIVEIAALDAFRRGARP